MADYYSHRDPRNKKDQQYLDYNTGGGAGWVWAGVILVAIVALIALGSTGGGETEATGTSPAAAVEAPAPTAPVSE